MEISFDMDGVNSGDINLVTASFKNCYHTAYPNSKNLSLQIRQLNGLF